MPVCVPAAFAATVCDCGVAEIVTLGTAFLTLVKDIVSLKVLLCPSESVTDAVIATLAAFVPFAKVLPAKVTKPVELFVTMFAKSELLPLNSVNPKFDVEPLYVSAIVTTAFAKESICSPVDFAETDCALFVVDSVKDGAAAFAFEYVTTFVISVEVPLPSLYLTTKLKEPLSAVNDVIPYVASSGVVSFGVQFVPVAEIISNLLFVDNPSSLVISSPPTFTLTEPLVATNEPLATQPVERAGNVAFSFVKFTDICDSAITDDNVTSSLYAVPFKSYAVNVYVCTPVLYW